MRKFILLTFLMCLFGGVKSSLLNAQDVVTIGDGTEGNYSIPFETYQSKSGSQTIYLSEEIGKSDGGTIDKISFYVSTHNSVTGRSIKVYLRNTTDDYFVRTDKFTNIVMTNADLVFDGNVDLNSVGWCTITLENGFNYDGTNLLVSVFDNSNSKANDTYFYQHASIYNENYFRTIIKSGGSSDPTMSGETYTNKSISPNIQISFVASTPSTPTAPTAPTLVSPENTATGIFNPALNFTLGNHTEHYQILMGEDTNEMTSVTGWVEKTNNTVSYQTNNLKSNTAYSWKVVARCSDGGTGYLETGSETWYFTTRNVTTAPGTPTLTAPADGYETAQNPLLQWSFGENTEEYQVLFGTDPDDLSEKQDWTNTGNASSGSYQTTDLDAGTYYWQVVTKNGKGETSSEVYSFTKVGAPDNVTPISPVHGETGVSHKVTLTWEFAPNTTHYRVLFAEGTPDGLAYEAGGTTSWLEVNGTEGSFATTDQDLNLNTTYYWCVDVKNDAGYRTYYNPSEDGQPTVFSFTTTNEMVEEAENLTSTLNNREVTLTWYYNEGNIVNGYQVLFGTDPNKMSVIKDWTERGAVSSNSFVKSDLEAGTKYYWQVNVRKDGGAALSSEIASFTTDPLPGAVTYVSPADNDSLNADPELSWTFGDNTDEYQVLFGTDPDTLRVKQDWTNTGNASSGSYQTSDLSANVTYYWQVNVRNNMGEVKGAVYSFIKSIRPDNVTPISPVHGETGVSNVATITWQFAPNTTHYKFLIDYRGYGLEYKIGGKEWVEVTDETGSFNTETLNLGALKTYSWAVEVKNDSGERNYYNGANPSGDVTLYSYTTSDIIAATYISPTEEYILPTNTAILKWSYGSGSNVTHYQVLYGTKDHLEVKQDWTERPSEGTGLAGTGTLTTEVLKNNTKYYWQVKVKQGDGGDILDGSVWSFISMLDVPQNVKADNDNVYTDTAHLTWDAIADASGYKVYVNGEERLVVNTNSADVTSLTYNDGAYNNIQVVALYDLDGKTYESAKSDTVQVMVIGYGKIEIVVQDYKNNRVEGVTITLNGKDAFDNDNQFTFTTNAQGEYKSPTMNVCAGTYTATISKDNYLTYTVENVVITYNETYDFGLVTLHSNFIFDVTIRKADFEHLEVILGYKSGEPFTPGNYTFYIKNETTGEIKEIGSPWFSTDDIAPELAQLWYTEWTNMLNGTYSFGVEVPNSGIINWTNNTTIRDYYIFDIEGDWSVQANWRGEEMPTDANDEVFLLEKATINEGETIHVGKVNIEKVSSVNVGVPYNGALVIKGTLISSDGVSSEGGYSDFVLYDGAQLRQTKGYVGTGGRFIMNIENPTEWSVWNKTGWQFISSPFTNAYISDFTGVNDEYDLYKFDGDHENLKVEWRNHKALKDDTEDPFEETFVSGRGYMASYKTKETATLNGYFNPASSWTYDGITYQEIQEGETHWPNFHLVGNPFSFDMDLSNLKTSSLATGIAYVNEVGGFDYMTTGTVKVGDGFFIRTVGQMPSCSYSESATRGNDNEPADNINITVSGKNTRDNVVLNFAGADKAGFPKMENFNEDVPCLYVSSEAKRWGIFNYDRDVKEVPLSFEAQKMGNYTISINPEGEYENITLVDRLTGIETNMLLEDYNFTATTSLKDNADRFIVRFALKSDIEEEKECFAYQSGDELIIDAEGAVQIFDVTGRMVYSNDVKNANRRINVGELDKAAYILRLINDEGVKVQKVIIY